MKNAFALTIAIALLGLCLAAEANVFDLGKGFTNLETVTVHDPGNAGEVSGMGAGGIGFNRVCGSVAYTYRIGKYEVTAKQYAEFLNAKAASDGDPHGLYNTIMGTTVGKGGCNIQRSGGGTVADPYVYTIADDWANRPVNYVSFWDSCRFANWLGNGQGDGDTETGAYSLLAGYDDTDGRSIVRNPGATWVVANEDEWYKAAYFKGGKPNAGYWDYAMGSDIPTTPSHDITDPDGGNNANFYQNGYAISSPYYRTNVGEYENSESAYGTFDQCGNVWEWNETVVYIGSTYSARGLRGGSFYEYESSLRASNRHSASIYNPMYEYYDIGFRVAYVPEPSSIIALAGGLVALIGMKRRRE